MSWVRSPCLQSKVEGHKRAGVHIARWATISDIRMAAHDYRFRIFGVGVGAEARLRPLPWLQMLALFVWSVNCASTSYDCMQDGLQMVTVNIVLCSASCASGYGAVHGEGRVASAEEDAMPQACICLYSL